MKTFSEKGKNLQKDWLLVDVNTCSTKILGRIATKIAFFLKGKHKTTYTPHLDCGDNVIIINSDKFEVSGNKEEQKIYYTHSGYMGGLKERTYSQQKEKNPRLIIYKAIRGMLPRTTLRKHIMRHLFIYTGQEHPHGAQMPKLVEI